MFDPQGVDMAVVSSKRISRRRVVAGLAVGVPAALLARPAVHLGLAAWNDADDMPAWRPGSVDDASRQSVTEVAEVYGAPTSMRDAEEGLRAVLARAAEHGRALSIAGARHTMGGHTAFPGGTVVDMANLAGVELVLGTDRARVQAGARWSQVIAYLHARGRSVWVMQSNSSFSVGGTLSVNAHGWQPDRPPVASTVERLRVMLVDGSVVACSRTDNAELFGLVLGGYGLFGIILDAEIRTVPNEMYRAERILLPYDGYVRAFAERVVGAADVGLAYGRLSVAPEVFLREAELTTYHRDAAFRGAIPPLTEPKLSAFKRAVFRGSVESDYGKSLRWSLERRFGGEAGTFASRNQILDEPVMLFANRRAAYTDILHEYFVAPDAFMPFVDRAREVVRAHNGDLLNVTVRNVLRDDDSFLRYASRDMFSLVMLFSARRTAEADDKMGRMTRDLVDAALGVDGCYYLPYRPHPTRAQFARAYPMASEFFAKKRSMDPRLVFRNGFWRNYGPAE